VLGLNILFVAHMGCVIFIINRHRESISKFDVIITSYDILRNDIENLGPINWNYCILDEGHVIKNGKTKLTKAIKTLKCMKRLILSGTPIQNNVLELWSLFDFLMPGFLYLLLSLFIFSRLI
jgi:TATA-binding protein-associated factor